MEIFMEWILWVSHFKLEDYEKINLLDLELTNQQKFYS